ncbi:hypothetical protein HY632_04120 [Candidatus Uhrbacteria bacterium]|nr:hypothetical protein [Candidatus Uhrbacteria bacterium]
MTQKKEMQFKVPFFASLLLAMANAGIIVTAAHEQLIALALVATALLAVTNAALVRIGLEGIGPHGIEEPSHTLPITATIALFGGGGITAIGAGSPWIGLGFALCASSVFLTVMLGMALVDTAYETGAAESAR